MSDTNLINRDAYTEEVVSQIADVVEDHAERLSTVEETVAAVEQAVNNGAVAPAAPAAPAAPPTPTEITVSIRYYGQSEGDIRTKAGTTIREVLNQLGGEYANITTAKAEGRVVPVTTPLTKDTVVEPTPQGGKVG